MIVRKESREWWDMDMDDLFPFPFPEGLSHHLSTKIAQIPLKPFEGARQAFTRPHILTRFFTFCQGEIPV